MRIDRYTPPKSSFLSVEKDLSIILGNMEKCSRLKRLLYYTTPDALEKETPSLSMADFILSEHIRITPKLYVNKDILNYLVIRFDTFTSNATNPHFTDNVIIFDVVCHYDQWLLKDYQLRPYRIAAEIDSMFNGKYLTGIGTLNFLGASQKVYTDEFVGFSLMYSTIHGEEDKNAYTPVEDDQKHYIDMFADIEKENEANGLV